MKFAIDSNTIANDWGNYKNHEWSQIQYYIYQSMMGTYPHELEEKVMKDVRAMNITDLKTIANTVKYWSRTTIEKYVKAAAKVEHIDCGSNMVK